MIYQTQKFIKANDFSHFRNRKQHVAEYAGKPDVLTRTRLTSLLADLDRREPPFQKVVHYTCSRSANNVTEVTRDVALFEALEHVCCVDPPPTEGKKR